MKSNIRLISLSILVPLLSLGVYHFLPNPWGVFCILIALMGGIKIGRMIEVAK